MQFRKAISLALMIAFTFSLGLAAQQRKQTRPTKYPQQLPNIIGDDNAQPAPQQQPAEPPGATGMTLSPQQTDALVRAVETLTGEVRGLVQEMRALNSRQQSQLDILRLTRADLRIDQYERELKTTRDRLAQLENDDQQLQLALKPENIEAQMRTLPTLNRDATMKQLRESYEARLRAVTNEKELLQRREAEISGAIKGYREAVGETEKRLQAVEESLRQLTPGAAEGPQGSPQRRQE